MGEGSHRYFDGLCAPLLALDANLLLGVVYTVALAHLGEDGVRRSVQFHHSLCHVMEHAEGREALCHALTRVFIVRVVLVYLRTICVGSASRFGRSVVIDVLQKKRGDRDRAQSLARGR